MNVYDVCFDFADYDFEHTEVHADNKREVRRIMKDYYGSNVVIHYIDKIS